MTAAERGEADPAGLVIRPLETLAEFRECVSLQYAIWGDGFSECVPVSLLRVTARLGGVISGAFLPEHDTLLGFVFGMTGWVDGRPVHWSDMLGVASVARGRGLGRQLKLHQRDRVLTHGVTRMQWTFDPLVARNAHLNLNRLGAVVHEYVPDFYGPSQSPLHGGLATDRFVATWYLDSPRVVARLAGVEAEARDPTRYRAVLEVARDPASGVIVPVARPPLGRADRLGGVRIPVPIDIDTLYGRAPESALAWRRTTRAMLMEWLERGHVVTALVPQPDEPAGGVAWYLLDPPSEEHTRGVRSSR